MTRLVPGSRLVLATHNPGKIREIGQLVAPLSISVVSAGELGLPEPEETGTTFAANAELKARAAAGASGLPALADDSGLVVDGLGGEPGVYSANWAGPGKDFAPAMARVLAGLQGNPNRAARFVTVLTLAFPDGRIASFEGKVEGGIAPEPRGESGFGYDPIFIPEGYDRTFGQFDLTEKQAISHRARAFALFAQACLG